MPSGLPLGPWAVILSLIALLLLNGTLWLARRYKTATASARRSRLTAEVSYLRREAAKLNTPSTYARCAKYQRLINVKEKELSELTAGPAVPGVAERLVTLGNAVKVLLLGTVTLALWEAPVAQVVPRSLAAPLGLLLAFPRGGELAAFGGVAVGPWLLLADTATGALARAVFPLPAAAALAAVASEVDVERLAREAEATGRTRMTTAATGS